MSVDICAELDNAPLKIPLNSFAVISPLALISPLAVILPDILPEPTRIPPAVVSIFF